MRVSALNSGRLLNICKRPNSMEWGQWPKKWLIGLIAAKRPISEYSGQWLQSGPSLYIQAKRRKVAYQCVIWVLAAMWPISV